MDKDFCREQAKLVRSLADNADPFIRLRLLRLAEHYERRLLILNARKSVARGHEQNDGVEKT